MSPNTNKKLVLFWLFVASIISILLLVLRSLVISLVVAGLIAYIMTPLVEILSKKIFKNWRRSSIVSSFIVFGLIFLLMGLAIPYLYQEAMELAKLLPGAFKSGIIKLTPVKAWLVSEGIVSEATLNELINELTNNNDLSQQLSTTAQKIWASTPKLFSGMINVLLIPLITFILLYELVRIKATLLGIIPKAIFLQFTSYLLEIDRILKGVLKGQLMVAAILAVLYMFGFSIVGLQFGIVIGAISGCFRVIPYLDVLVGTILSMIVIVSKGAGLGTAVGVMLVFVIVQLIDGMIITPRIMGERTGIHPGLVILSMIVFTDWFGLFGIFIAVPLLAFMKVSGALLISTYKKSHFYLSN